MRIYETVDDTIKEWSRILLPKGIVFRVYSTNAETIDRWSKGLAKIYGKPFAIKKDTRETLEEWSKLF